MSKRELIKVSGDFSEYEILAIHSALSITSLAWSLDRAFSTSFWLSNEPFEFQLQKKNSEHICYKFVSEEENTCFWLLANSGSVGFLTSKKPKSDFFIISYGENAMEISKNWVKTINKILGIELAYIVRDEAKEKMQWVFWLQNDEN